MQYYDYYDLKDLKEIEQRILTLSNLKTYAMIDHDKDLTEDKHTKKKHFHIVLTFKDTTTSKTVANAMCLEEQYINKIKTTTKTAELYLIHKNNPEKWQYDPHEVISNFDYVEKYDGVQPMQQQRDIAAKIANGEIKHYALTNFIGCDEYSRHKVYYERCFDYRYKSIKGVDRELECIFISGPTGCGKTTLAKNYAAQFGYTPYVSAGGKNPLDDYEGQECIILDDLRDSTYKLSDFLKLCDNNTDSLVGCRFYNKSINECKLLIVTSTKDIHEFYYNATFEDRESQQQLFRRFKVHIVLDPDKVKYYNYNPILGDYDYAHSIVNPAKILFNSNAAYDFSKKFIDILGAEKLEELEAEFKLTDEDVAFIK